MLAKARIIQKDRIMVQLGLFSQASAAAPMHFKPGLAMTGKAAASHNWFNGSKHVGESSCFYEAHSPYSSSLLQALTISPKCSEVRSPNMILCPILSFLPRSCVTLCCVKEFRGISFLSFLI